MNERQEAFSASTSGIISNQKMVARFYNAARKEFFAIERLGDGVPFKFVRGNFLVVPERPLTSGLATLLPENSSMVGCTWTASFLSLCS